MTTQLIATKLSTEADQKTARGDPISINQPAIVGMELLPMVKPTVTKATTAPSMAGGASVLTMMSRDGVKMPFVAPAITSATTMTQNEATPVATTATQAEDTKSVTTSTKS